MAYPRALTERQEQSVAKAYARGTSTSALAEKHGVHPSTIRGAVVRQGGTLRSRGGVPGQRKSR